MEARHLESLWEGRVRMAGNEGEEEEEDVRRRKRALQAALLYASGDADELRRGVLASSTRERSDALEGLPTKAVILGMGRRELEALVVKFPGILPPEHASFHRLLCCHVISL